MTTGERIRQRREELGLSRVELAKLLNITPAAVSNYENGVSFPKADILLRLFDCLETDPNTLFQDSFHNDHTVLKQNERRLIDQYRELSPHGQKTVHSIIEALRVYQDNENENNNLLK